MRTAVPEEFGDLDFVRTADLRLRRNHARVVLAFFVAKRLLPRLRIVAGQCQRLLPGLGFRRRFLDHGLRFLVGRGRIGHRPGSGLLADGVHRGLLFGRRRRSGPIRLAAGGEDEKQYREARCLEFIDPQCLDHGHAHIA